MNRIEDDLKSALRRRPAPPGFAAKVFERIESEALNRKTPWGFIQSWAREAFQKEVLVFASAVLLILVGVMQPGGNQNLLANTISQLKVIIGISARLNRITSMDCFVCNPGAGLESSCYRVRWSARGITRVDRESKDGMQQALWISNTTVPPDPVWQPAMEFLTPALLARHLEGFYGRMQAGQRNAAEPDAFLLAGRKNQQIIEIAVDEKTYLPRTIRKYSPDSGTGDSGNCVLEVRFLWDRPIPEELLIPHPAAGNHSSITDVSSRKGGRHDVHGYPD